jgi:hypothetical protein
MIKDRNENNEQKNYRVCISSPPDRNKLVAEIFFGNIQWAEINQEGTVLKVEFYLRPDGQPWKIDFSNAIDALQEAKLKLVG